MNFLGTFGDDPSSSTIPSPADTFNTQIGIYNSQLVTLFRQKIMLSGSREAERFQYVSGWNTQFSTAVQNMLGQCAADQDWAGFAIMQNYSANVQASIAMTDMSGTLTWDKSPVVSSSADPNVCPVGTLTYLSTLEDIFVNDCFIGYPTVPAYQVPGTLYDNPGISAQAVVDATFLNSNGVGVWPNAVASVAAGTDLTILPIPVPPTSDLLTWLVSQFNIHPFNQMSQIAADCSPWPDCMANSFPYVIALCSQEFNGQSFVDVINAGRNMYSDIVNQTFQLIEVQNQIDATTASLSSFISENATYAGSTTTADIVNAAMAAAQAPTADTSTSAPVPAPASSPNWLLIGAAAVGGFFLVKK